MSVQPALVLDRLFTPGARLGWVFRDLRRLVTPFGEPEPDPERTCEQAAARAAATQVRYARARRWLVKPSLVIGLLLFLLAGYDEDRHRMVTAVVLLVLAISVTGFGPAYTARSWWRQRRAASAAAQPEREYRRAWQAWQKRAAAHLQAELGRLGPAPEWLAAEPPTRRTDVFGGSLPGWQGLLTVHGASLLTAQPLLVVDLSGQLASDQLTAAAQAARVPGAWYALPADLGRSGLLAQLSPAAFADALVEAIHAGTPGGTHGMRTDRAVDVRILEQLTAALDGHVSPARLTAAVAAALGQPVPPGVLGPREQALISGAVFPSGYLQQIVPNLVRLEAFLSDLARYTGYAPVLSPPPPPAWRRRRGSRCGGWSARRLRGRAVTRSSSRGLTRQGCWSGNGSVSVSPVR